jgi:hypothetical protein
MSDINIEGNMWTSYLTDQVEILTGNSSTVVGGFLSFVTMGGSIDLTIGAEATEINIAALLLDINMGYQFESSAGGGYECNLSPLGTEAPGLEYIGSLEVVLSSPPSTITLEPESIIIDTPMMTVFGIESITLVCGGNSVVVSEEGVQVIAAGGPLEILSSTEIEITAAEINLTGDVAIMGDLTVVGAVGIEGAATIEGNTSITGTGTIVPGPWMAG